MIPGPLGRESISSSRAKLAPCRKLVRFSARATWRVAPAGAQKRWARYNELGALSETLPRAVYFGRPLQRTAHSGARSRTSFPTSTPYGRTAAAARAPRRPFRRFPGLSPRARASAPSPPSPAGARAPPSSEEQRPSARCRAAPARCSTKRLQGMYCSNFMNLVHVLNCSFYSIVLNIVDEFVV